MKWLFSRNKRNSKNPVLVTESQISNQIEPILIRMRVINNEHGSYAVIFPTVENDPHAHATWKQVKDDLINKLGFHHVNSGGIIAFAEMTDTFQSSQGNIYLMHDADPGDLTLSTDNENTFVDVIKCFEQLKNYKIDYVKNT